MKKHVDAHCRHVTYVVGDWVYVKRCPHRQHLVARRINPKFYPQYLGPFLVISKIGEVAYKVKLLDSARIYPVFHVSQLKRSLNRGSVAAALPPGMEVEDPEIPQPEAVIATQLSSTLEWSILWKLQPVEEATWETAASIKDKFPSFWLEDKADFVADDIDEN